MYSILITAQPCVSTPQVIAQSVAKSKIRLCVKATRTIFFLQVASGSATYYNSTTHSRLYFEHSGYIHAFLRVTLQQEQYGRDFSRVFICDACLRRSAS